jgi:hypothetical protein
VPQRTPFNLLYEPGEQPRKRQKLMKKNAKKFIPQFKAAMKKKHFIFETVFDLSRSPATFTDDELVAYAEFVIAHSTRHPEGGLSYPKGEQLVGELYLRALTAEVVMRGTFVPDFLKKAVAEAIMSGTKDVELHELLGLPEMVEVGDPKFIKRMKKARA